MNDDFAVALRELLVEQPRRRRAERLRSRVWTGSLGLRVVVAGLVIAGAGGAAAATGVLPLPGSPVNTPLAVPVSVTGSGTETIKLGPAPQGANAIQLQLRCLTAGSFTFADGSSAQCGGPDTGSELTTVTLALASGQQTASIVAGPGQRWQATAVYISATLSPWKTNANGQTYGTINQNGTPDLVAVDATNGQQGYVYATQLNPPGPTSPAQALAEQAANSNGEFIPVYESDGTTVIGRFEVAEPGAIAR
jgi:hypothetical protein